MKIWRQGDVVLREAKIPKDAVYVGNEIRIVGETGHAHVLGGKAYDSMGHQYITLEQPTELVHEEHSRVLVEAGTYEVTRVRDFLPERPIGD